ncbi:hypothetical protein CANTEDRAFT_128559 [Yamadazyma tenuis ATCC 10573]|uniref:ORC2-domain-containing protein n=1 Tax=Candida tenuis (strain ATCC 10573 / BCRC 21748 / CBS 615 / JCM 9827 / NBRC 10315 / NRRL Y-1498 / VKM Y-70) TaxID=590646 RepID=G3BCR5_CANTC|nr:uncharacterized protein CANTEDRAFT_128559 [Yamadazyma tenuis ATCC 10573]EGV60862.1 hypothetical protein CANTEDRAFT_128559 [Yamadazyma tenuis ATCC 10573]
MGLVEYYNKGLEKGFETPSIKRVISVFPQLSPSPVRDISTTSPSRKGIIFPSPSHRKISPARTPRGRAGLPSPTKRSFEDVNNSAVKRAHRVKISSILNDEDSFYDDGQEELNEQDLRIAESIIQSSHEENGGIRLLFGQDIPFEIDPSDEELRRVRRKPIILDVDSGDEDDANDSEIDKDVSEIDSEIDGEEDSDEMLSDEAVSKYEVQTTPSKRGRGRPRKLRPVPPSEDESPRKKRAKYEILSIFRQDDADLLANNPVKSETTTIKKLEKTNASDTFWDDLEPMDIPYISGIPEDELVTLDRSKRQKFDPLPIPPVGADGELPASYVKKYLPNIKWENSKEGEALDDRSYFSEGTEGYFDQMSHRERHAVYSLSSLGIDLSNSEFLDRVELLKYFKPKQKLALSNLLKKSYHQWCFELSQDFNICFYGTGSKIELITDFATNYLTSWLAKYHQLKNEEIPNVLVMNGYNPSCKVKDIMESLVSVLVPEEYRVRRHYSKILSDSFPLLLKQLERQRKNTKSPKPRLILVIHCIDSESLRDDKTQVQLCQLANLPEVKLICSAENIAAPLLWDSFKAENYNFVYHDITTYQPYIVETSFKDAIDIGKTKRTSSSRGAMFVLRALNENSKTIYKILLESQIERIKQLNPKSGVRSTRGTLRTAIDFKALHKNCMEHFVTSNEISFRAMLTEFLEHNMCKLTKDDAGTEKVFIAYTFEEMNKLLKESLK